MRALFIFVALLVTGCGAAQQGPPSIVGKWKYITETRTYGADLTFEQRFTATGLPDMVLSGTYSLTPTQVTKNITQPPGDPSATYCQVQDYKLTATTLTLTCQGQDAVYTRE